MASASMAMGDAPHQPTSALVVVFGRTRHVEENKSHSLREEDEPLGITHLLEPLLLFKCKAAKTKIEPTI